MRSGLANSERGQEIVLFGVMLAVVVTVGGMLALNLIWLRTQWTALQEAALSAAAAATLELEGVPGVQYLDKNAAKEIAERVLADNLATLPFLDAEPERIAGKAEIRVHNPPSAEPYVELEFRVPIRLPWPGWKLILSISAIAVAGETPD